MTIGPRLRALAIFIVTTALIGAFVPVRASSAEQGAGATSFERSSWLADYDSLRMKLERSYANLAWFASPQGGRDLPALHRRTIAALGAANDDRSARAALEAFVAGIGDGHFSVLPDLAPTAAQTVAPVPPPSRGLDAKAACAALGFTRNRGVAFSTPFDALPGFRLLSDGVSEAYRSGMFTTSAGLGIGVLRLPNFVASENPPECERAWTDAQKDADAKAPCDDGCRSDIRDRVDALLLEHLHDRLLSLQRAGATAVVVDLGNNPGGGDLGDWVPRLFTKSPVRSARLGLVRDPASAAYYDEQLTDLRAALKLPLSAGDRRAVDDAIAVYEAHRAEVVDGHACPMAWVWNEQRAWAPLGAADRCSNLVFGNTFASGARDYLPADAIRSRAAARAIYWPSVASALAGTWQRPVYVVVDRRTYSAGELAAAVFEDNGVGKLLGDTTGGDGCGFMYTSNYVLPSGRMRFRIPNCVRLRKDGRDEVAGIRPDWFVPAYAGETAAQHAKRLLDAVTADLAPRVAH